MRIWPPSPCPGILDPLALAFPSQSLHQPVHGSDNLTWPWLDNLLALQKMTSLWWSPVKSSLRTGSIGHLLVKHLHVFPKLVFNQWPNIILFQSQCNWKCVGNGIDAVLRSGHTECPTFSGFLVLFCSVGTKAIPPILSPGKDHGLGLSCEPRFLLGQLDHLILPITNNF